MISRPKKTASRLRFWPMAIAAGANTFLLVVGTALGSGLFTGQYEPENWTLSVLGAPVSPASGPTDEVTFSYNANGLIWSQWRDYWFHNTADQTSAIEFDWQFSSCHSWFQSQARAYAWADDPIGRTYTRLVFAGVGVFNGGETASINVTSGHSFGFLVQGFHDKFAKSR